MQIYRGMDIGTAKPENSALRLVPHHLMDTVDPFKNYSVSEFQSAARWAVENIASRGKLPFLVGGTGLYFEAIVFDLRFPPGSIDDPLRRKLEEWATRDPDGLRRKLSEIDPGFASTESYVNIRRVIRAMEVYQRTGSPISSFQSKRGEHRILYPFVGAALNAPRHLLHKVIDARVDQMIAVGLVDEVRGLETKGGFSRTARQAIGYKEILDHLDRGRPLDETISYIKKRSHSYAKRQLTWFRQIPGLRWFEMCEEDFEGSYSPTLNAVRDYLKEELQLENDET